MSDQKDPNIFQIAFSLLAAFFGVQSKEKMERDATYIDKKGFKVYVIMGFFLVFCIIITVIGIVQLIVHFAR